MVNEAHLGIEVAPVAVVTVWFMAFIKTQARRHLSRCAPKRHRMSSRGLEFCSRILPDFDGGLVSFQLCPEMPSAAPCLKEVSSNNNRLTEMVQESVVGLIGVSRVTRAATTLRFDRRPCNKFWPQCRAGQSLPCPCQANVRP